MKNKTVWPLFILFLVIGLNSVYAQDSSDNGDDMLDMGETLNKGLQGSKDSTYFITSYELADAYDANQFDADDKYKDKTIGIVACSLMVKTTIAGQPMMVLGTSKGLPPMVVYFDDSTHIKKQLATVHMFQIVKVLGKCLGLQNFEKENGEDFQGVVINGKKLEVVELDTDMSKF